MLAYSVDVCVEKADSLPLGGDNGSKAFFEVNGSL